MNSLHLLLQRFADANLEFVIVGGYAGVLHGSSLVTNDLDVCAVLTAENVVILRHVLAAVHPIHRMTHPRRSFLEHPPAGQALSNLYLETDDGIIDILSTIAGVGDFDRLRQNAIKVPLFGRQVWVISIPDLIEAKAAIGRDKDLLAIKELRAIVAKRGAS